MRHRRIIARGIEAAGDEMRTLILGLAERERLAWSEHIGASPALQNTLRQLAPASPKIAHLAKLAEAAGSGKRSMIETPLGTWT